jgi:hypothetical protein
MRTKLAVMAVFGWLFGCGEAKKPAMALEIAGKTVFWEPFYGIGDTFATCSEGVWLTGACNCYDMPITTAIPQKFDKTVGWNCRCEGDGPVEVYVMCILD